MSSQPRSAPRWPWAIVVVLVAAAGWWLFRQQSAQQAPLESTAATETQSPVPATSTPAATPQPVDTIQHPVNSDAADAALPAMADSDTQAWGALSQAFGNDAVLGILLREHLIQRIVVMVDNLTQPSLTRTALAVKPVDGTLQVKEGGAAMEIDAANAQRYTPYVNAFTSADATALVKAYQRFYPLVQQAYLELGTQGYFNDRLVAVIDHLLQAPEPAGPLTVEPNGKGRFRFTDPALEQLSVGQKALVRLGPQQEAAVKTQLKAIRTALTQMD